MAKVLLINRIQASFGVQGLKRSIVTKLNTKISYLISQSR